MSKSSLATVDIFSLLHVRKSVVETNRPYQEALWARVAAGRAVAEPWHVGLRKNVIFPTDADAKKASLRQKLNLGAIVFGFIAFFIGCVSFWPVLMSLFTVITAVGALAASLLALTLRPTVKHKPVAVSAFAVVLMRVMRTDYEHVQKHGRLADQVASKVLWEKLWKSAENYAAGTPQEQNLFEQELLQGRYVMDKLKQMVKIHNYSSLHAEDEVKAYNNLTFS